MADKIIYNEIFDKDILDQFIAEFKRAEKDIKVILLRIKKEAGGLFKDVGNMKQMQADIKKLEKLIDKDLSAWYKLRG